MQNTNIQDPMWEKYINFCEEYGLDSKNTKSLKLFASCQNADQIVITIKNNYQDKMGTFKQVILEILDNEITEAKKRGKIDTLHFAYHAGCLSALEIVQDKIIEFLNSEEL